MLGLAVPSLVLPVVSMFSISTDFTLECCSHETFARMNFTDDNPSTCVLSTTSSIFATVWFYAATAALIAAAICEQLVISDARDVVRSAKRVVTSTSGVKKCFWDQDSAQMPGLLSLHDARRWFRVYLCTILVVNGSVVYWAFTTMTPGEFEDLCHRSPHFILQFPSTCTEKVCGVAMPPVWPLLVYSRYIAILVACGLTLARGALTYRRLRDSRDYLEFAVSFTEMAATDSELRRLSEVQNSFRIHEELYDHRDGLVAQVAEMTGIASTLTTTISAHSTFSEHREVWIALEACQCVNSFETMDYAWTQVAMLDDRYIRHFMLDPEVLQVDKRTLTTIRLAALNRNTRYLVEPKTGESLRAFRVRWMAAYHDLVRTSNTDKNV